MFNKKAKIFLSAAIFTIFTACDGKISNPDNSNNGGNPPQQVLKKGEKILFFKNVDHIVASKNNKYLYVVNNDGKEGFKALEVKDSLLEDIVDENKWSENIDIIDTNSSGINRIRNIEALEKGVVVGLGFNHGESKFLVNVEGNKKNEQIYEAKNNRTIYNIATIKVDSQEYILDLYHNGKEISWFNNNEEKVVTKDELSLNNSGFLINGNDEFYVITQQGIHTVAHSNIDNKTVLPEIEATQNNSLTKCGIKNPRVTKAIYANNKVYLAINKVGVAVFDTVNKSIAPVGKTWDNKKELLDIAVNDKGDVFALTKKEIFKLDDKGDIVENIITKLDTKNIINELKDFTNFAFVNNYLLFSVYGGLFIFSQP